MAKMSEGVYSLLCGCRAGSWSSAVYSLRFYDSVLRMCALWVREIITTHTAILCNPGVGY